MLSYRWDSRAVAGLSTLLHGKKSACFCRRGCHAPEKELLWGQVSPLCRSQFESIIQTDHPYKEKKGFFFYLGGISCVSVCVPCPSRKSVAPSLALPSVQVSATPGTPRAFPSPGWTVPAPSAGCYTKTPGSAPALLAQRAAGLPAGVWAF